MAGLGELVQARVVSAMLTDRPQPAALIAWLAGIILENIPTLLATPAGTETDLNGPTLIHSRATSIVETARGELADESPTPKPAPGFTLADRFANTTKCIQSA